MRSGSEPTARTARRSASIVQPSIKAQAPSSAASPRDTSKTSRALGVGIASRWMVKVQSRLDVGAA
jgi:hypothetical protein